MALPSSSASLIPAISGVPESHIYCNLATRMLLALYALEDKQRKNLLSAGISRDRVFVRYSDWLKRCELVTNAPRAVAYQICSDLIGGDFVSLSGPFVSSLPDQIKGDLCDI